MAKQIHNYKLITKKRQRKKLPGSLLRIHRRKLALCVVLLLCVLAVGNILLGSKCDYYVYKEKKETEDNGDVSYEAFANGYLKYSGNGIAYQKEFGKSVWNVALSFSQPFMATSTSYALLGDKGENTAILFDKTGEVTRLTLRYPLLQASVSDQGIMEVILEGKESNYIQVYGKDGELIADMKSSLDETGYPVTAALSPDGTRLAVSYYSISGKDAKSSVIFYDFSQQLQSEDVTLKGSFDYEGVLMPKISFLGADTVAVFGPTSTYFYDIEDKPTVKKELTFDREIESVFESDDYVGYVLDNTEDAENGRYEIQLYNKKGARKLSRKLDMDYDSIKLWGEELIAVKDNECMIMDIHGNVLFQGELEGNSIETILPAGGWRKYHVVFRDQIVLMQLKFWGSEK